MNIQEIEHIEHVAGSASEFQNSYAQSRLEHSAENSRVRGLIQSFVDGGQYVIVCSSPTYCRVTDAIVGEHLSIRGAYGDRGAAERSMRAMFEAGHFDPEESVYIYPFPVNPPDMVVDDSEQVPF